MQWTPVCHYLFLGQVRTHCHIGSNPLHYDILVLRPSHCSALFSCCMLPPFVSASLVILLVIIDTDCQSTCSSCSQGWYSHKFVVSSSFCRTPTSLHLFMLWCLCLCPVEWHVGVNGHRVSYTLLRCHCLCLSHWFPMLRYAVHCLLSQVCQWIVLPDTIVSPISGPLPCSFCGQCREADCTLMMKTLSHSIQWLMQCLHMEPFQYRSVERWWSAQGRCSL